VVLVNSNPATIMTDPEFADATYVEPITPEIVAKVIERERPDAILATLGGQTALNTAMALHAAGVLEEYGVELIGANIAAIEAGEDRQKFKEVVASIGAESARSAIARDMDGCLAAAAELGYPLVVRPSFTMGGLGSGLARNEEELRRIAGSGLQASPTSEVLLEESLLGWKEFELELMRDRSDNVVRMEGRLVYQEAVDHMELSCRSLLHLAELDIDDVDLVIAHQANGRIINAVRERFGLEPERVADYVAGLGNTSAASIPLALSLAEDDGRLPADGGHVLLTAFGAGFSWGAALLTY